MHFLKKGFYFSFFLLNKKEKKFGLIKNKNQLKKKKIYCFSGKTILSKSIGACN